MIGDKIWRNAGDHNLTNLFYNNPDIEIKEFLYIKKSMSSLFPFWLDTLIGAKLVRICHIAKVNQKDQLAVKDLDKMPFLLHLYFKCAKYNIYQQAIVLGSKMIFKLSQEFFGKFLMKDIQIKNNGN